jgi:hypothetical protein
VPSIPLGRRQFLGAAAGSAAGFTLSPACLGAANRELRDLSFVVVSDTHLGYRSQEHAADLWRRTAAEIADGPGEFVLHLGDVVDGGREAQYPVYLAERETIGKPVHEIPGNHDPADLFAKYVRDPIDRAINADWLQLLLLNNSRRDSHDGFVSAEQMEWIERQCVEAGRDDRFVALCLHVPVHANLHPDRGWYVKPENGQTALYELLTRHRDRVLCLMHGHFHNGIRGWDDHAPLHEISFPSALYNQDRRLEEQQAPGYNPLEFRPGYTLVEIRDGSLTLRYKPTGEDPSVERDLRFSQL